MADYKMIGNDFYDFRSQKLAVVKGADIYDTHSQKIATIRDYEIYNDRYQKLAMLRGEDVFDAHNVRMISVSEIRRLIDNPPGPALCTALWWFFIKK